MPSFPIVKTLIAIAIITPAIPLLLSACGSNTAAPPVTVTKTTAAAQSPAPTVQAPTSTAKPAAQIVIPQVVGQNAEIVRKRLEGLGLTDVNLSSANPKYSVVVLASNWTVVSIEPAPGTSVNADDPVVVKVTKE
jgi:PASTA domain